MQFTSVNFSIYLPAVFLAYYVTGRNNKTLQNIILILAGLVFAALWSPLCAALLAVTSFISFITGKYLPRLATQEKQRNAVIVSVSLLLLILAVFKYYNFFAAQLSSLFALAGISFIPQSFQFILPVSISFFILQNTGYIIDIYREERQPELNAINYFAFSTFFPLLSAGPIERSTTLLPQFSTARVFNYNNAVAGCRLILWGLFKKMVISENAGLAVNDVFRNYPDFAGSTLLIGAVLYSVQIYTDFSGYTDIARGAALLLGLKVTDNFNKPYFSLSVTEFWRRWHISLSSWLRDYCFIPLSLALRNTGKASLPLATLFVFFISGLWHGAGYTFLLWGVFHGIIITGELYYGKVLARTGKITGTLYTFSLVTFFWIFFRAGSIHEATEYIQHTFNASLFTLPELILRPGYYILFPLYFVLEWYMKDAADPFFLYRGRYATVIRWGMYYAVLLAIVLFGGVDNDFIYFRF